MKDVKARDSFLVQVNKATEWMAGKASLFLGGLVLLLVIAAAAGLWNHFSEGRENEWQEKYFSIERDLLEKKQGFEQALQQEKAPKAKLPAVTAVKASGDLEKDYGDLPKKLSDLVQAAPKTRAGEMAALNLAGLQREYKKPSEASATLAKVNSGDRTSDLLGALVVHMKAGLKADQGDCKGAVSLWEKIERDHQARFLQDESRLRMGLCYESMNDSAKAESLYAEVAKKDAKDTDPAASKEAEKYLRLLRLKKVRGS